MRELLEKSLFSPVAFLCAQNATFCSETQQCSISIQRTHREKNPGDAKSFKSNRLRRRQKRFLRIFCTWHGVRLRGHSVVAKHFAERQQSWPAGPLTNVSERLPCPWLLSQLKRFRRVRGPGFFLPANRREAGRLLDCSSTVTACHLFSPPQ